MTERDTVIGVSLQCASHDRKSQRAHERRRMYNLTADDPRGSSYTRSNQNYAQPRDIKRIYKRDNILH